MNRLWYIRQALMAVFFVLLAAGLLWAGHRPLIHLGDQPTLVPVAVPRATASLALEAPFAAEAEARPLFAASRRPSADEKAVSDDPVSEELWFDTEGLSLRGVITLGKRREALLASDADPEGSWVGLGDRFEGWLLLRVRKDRVDLEGGGDVVTLFLRPEQEEDGDGVDLAARP
ncbi:MAG: hypothetical protein ACFB6S_08055 [Geminicoccaceae bacterium]